MKITKLGHCCLLIEIKGKRILTDPGSFTAESHSKLTNIDYILYTHEHQDHFHIESLKVLLQNNPKAVIYANDSVSDLLQKEGLRFTMVKDNDSFKLGDIAIIGIGEKHALLHSSIPQSSNLGFFIDERLWYPGDAFTDPKRTVEILALPVWAPWLKIGEAIDYALMLKPKVAFPVHDAMKSGMMDVLIEKILSPKGIKFASLKEGESKNFN